MVLRSTRTPTRGFTLVELLVVVMLIGLMGSVAMVSSADDDAVALDLVSVQVEDAIQRARALAVSQRVAHGVVFDATGDRFAVVDEFGDAVPHPVSKKDWVVGFDTPGEVSRIDVKTADFGDAGSAAMFDADGQPVAGGSVTFARDDVTLVMSFDGATGKVTSSLPE